MEANLTYDGTLLIWPDQAAVYRATSGLTDGTSDYRNSQFVCVSDAGPIPEGVYRFSTAISGQAGGNSATCSLSGSGTGVETIPRGAAAGDCEPYWANWGTNRVRLQAWDGVAVRACGGRRGGFYLHDSTKGYTHGCIEVEPEFFVMLRGYSRSAQKGLKRHLLLRVKYPSNNSSTYGNTAVSPSK